MKMRLFYIERIEDYLNQLMCHVKKAKTKKEAEIGPLLKKVLLYLIRFPK